MILRGVAAPVAAGLLVGAGLSGGGATAAQPATEFTGSREDPAIGYKTSLQSQFIGPENPRAIFFKDNLALARIPGARLLEVAVQDPLQGIIFHAQPQIPVNPPQFGRLDGTCLTCHVSQTTLGVPGLGMVSAEISAIGVDDRYASSI